MSNLKKFRAQGAYAPCFHRKLIRQAIGPCGRGLRCRSLRADCLPIPRPPALIAPLRGWRGSQRTPGKAKAEVEAPGRRVEPVAVGRPAVSGPVVPAAAPEDAEGARTRTRRIDQRATRVIAMPVAAPLPHITMHVVKAKIVRSLLTHRVCLATAVFTVPCVLPKTSLTLAKTVRCAATSPASILPLRLRR